MAADRPAHHTAGGGRSAVPDARSGLAAYPDHRAGMAVTTLVSHDGKTLLILTSGFNKMSLASGKPDPAAASEFVFVFDIAQRTPRQIQVLPVPNTDGGIAFAPDDLRFYVAGGVDDLLHVYARQNGHWAEDGAAIALGHATGLGLKMKPSAAGLALSADGTRAIVANRHNDSISIIDTGLRKAIAELDLRPGKNDPARRGMAGGEYPDWVAVRGNDTAYVSSERDREIVVVALAGPRIAARIKLAGVPNRLLLNADGSVLYAAADNSDSVSVIDTKTDRVTATIPVAAPQGVMANAQRFGGAAPNALALSPDEHTLYVSDGGINAIAVADLHGTPFVAGLVPTAGTPIPSARRAACSMS